MLRAAVLSRPFERVNVELATPAVALGHPDTPFLDLLAYTLGNGDSSRLVPALATGAKSLAAAFVQPASNLHATVEPVKT